jgi:serine/threonine-protein kinase
VKILHAHLAVYPEILERFLREGYLGNRVGHPDVVHVIDDDVGPDGAPFLVMELLDGCSLDERIEREGPLPLGDAARILTCVLSVLESAHEKGIVHRDLKPANLFQLRNGSIKVLDFGIARIAEPAGNQAMTKGGAVLGTPSFMPPEQARGRVGDVDARSDLWAAGATFFALLANCSLRAEAETANEALLYAMSKPIAPMASLLPSLPTAVGAFLDRALALEKSARFCSATEMKEELARALERSGSAALTARHSRPSALETGIATPFEAPEPPPAGTVRTDGIAPKIASRTTPFFAAPVTPVTPVTSPIVSGSASHVEPSRAPRNVALAGGLLLLFALVGAAIALSRDDAPAARLEASAHASGESTRPPNVPAAAAPVPRASAEPPVVTPIPAVPSDVKSSAPTKLRGVSSTARPPDIAPLDRGRF